MMKSKKLISFACALAMILSLFSAFTVAQAASTATITATVAEGSGTKAGETVTFNFAYEGLADTDPVNMVQFTMPIDTSVMTYTSGSGLGSFAGATTGYNDATGVYSFAFTAINPVVGASNELSTATFTLAADLPANYEMALATADMEGYDAEYNTITYTVSKPEILLNEYVPSTKITATVVENGTKAGETVKIKFAYEGFADTDPVNMVQFTMPIDTAVMTYASGSGLGSFAGATTGYNDATGVYSFAFTAINPVVGAANDLSEASFTLVTDLPENYELTLATADMEGYDAEYNTITYDIAKPTIVLNAPVVGDSYAITVKDGIENGTVTAPATAVEGSTVTVTATPAEGYVLGTIKVNGAAIEGTSFTMPSEDVEIDATFELAPVSYDLTLDVKKDSTVAAGSKVTIKATGTYADKFDVVVQVYNADGVAMGYVIFDEVAVDEENTFYAPATCKVSVNAVDEIGETSDDLLGNLVAAKVSK